MLLCHHPSCTVTWVQQLDILCNWMSQVDTEPSIQNCLLSTLEHHSHRSFWFFVDPLNQQAASDQDPLVCSGWWSDESPPNGFTSNLFTIPIWALPGQLCYGPIVCVNNWSYSPMLCGCPATSRSRNSSDYKNVAPLLTSIWEQFCLGLLHNLLVDHFYITPGPQGFSLHQVLELPPKDQQLWIHAVTNARERGCPLPPS